MSFLGTTARTYMMHRLARGGGRRPNRYGRPGGYGSGFGSPSGRRGRPARSGFGMRGPFPTYSRRGRRSNVTVTGCCLPIPLALSLGGVAVARHTLRAR